MASFFSSPENEYKRYFSLSLHITKTSHNQIVSHFYQPSSLKILSKYEIQLLFEIVYVESQNVDTFALRNMKIVVAPISLCINLSVTFKCFPVNANMERERE